MADPLPVPDAFVMRGARAAMAQGLAHVEEQVTALERAVVENPGLAFDLAKTLVESACRTILTERQQPYASDDDLPKLFKTVTTFLPLSPPSASSSGGHKSLKQTVNGLHTALQGVCELRNDFGFASHGSDGSRPRMESVQAILAAQAADTIVGFLHATHQQDRAVQRTVPLRFEDHADFNDYVDDAHSSVQIFDLSFRASEVLFRVDHEAYRDALASFEASEENGASAAVERLP
ncbi:MAG: abortive infection family protein [Myxococcales bacterium]|nr:abortive infection family protein [Myxococcales bacterium]